MPNDPEEVDSRVTEIPSNVKRATAVDKRVAKPKIKSEPAKKSVNVLLVTDPSLEEISIAYAVKLYKDAMIKKIRSWDDLAKLLKGYSTIRRLVLNFHGTTGALIVGGTVKGLKDARSFFTDYSPTISRIDFEACSVAKAPEEMYEFAKIFNTHTVAGYNYYNIANKYSLHVPKDVDVKKLKELWKTITEKCKGYFVPGMPTLDQMMKNPRARPYVLWYEWYRDEFDSEDLPKKASIWTRKTYKRRTDAHERHVVGSKCKALRKDYESPTFRFEHVLVNVKR